MRKNYLIGSVVLSALFALALGCDKKTDNSAPQPQPQPGPNPQPKGGSLGSPDFALTAPEFHKEFEANQGAAEAKYNGKVIEIRGVVGFVTRDDDNEKNSKVMLDLPEDSTPSCICKVADKNLGAKLGRGQSVRIKGTYEKNFPAPTLTACEVLEKGPDTTVSVTAETLAKEYGADSRMCDQKFGKKTLVVTGEITALETNESGEKIVILKGDGSTAIAVQYMHSFRGWPAHYVKGARVKMAAGLMFAWSRDGRCVLLMDSPLDPD